MSVERFLKLYNVTKGGKSMQLYPMRKIRSPMINSETEFVKSHWFYSSSYKSPLLQLESGIDVAPGIDVRGFNKSSIKVAWSLQFLGYLRTLSSFWLSQLNWDSQLGRDRKTTILLVAFWISKLQVLKYPKKVDFTPP